MCNNSIHENITSQCYYQALEKVMDEMDEEKKTCAIKEYAPNQMTKADTPGKFTIYIEFISSRSFTDHRWTKKVAHIAKTLKTEYLMINEIGVIGTVGGTLGLFMGLSFLDVSSWLLDAMESAWSFASRRAEKDSAPQRK